MFKPTPSHIVGFCKGMERGHDILGIVLVCKGYGQLGVGVIMMGLGWMACRRVWERREMDRFEAELREKCKHV